MAESNIKNDGQGPPGVPKGDSIQGLATNAFGEGTSHSPNENEGNRIREAKSLTEYLNNPTKTKVYMNLNLRIHGFPKWMATNSYTYHELIKRPTRYTVPEYNIILMAESAAEITEFINCFEVLTNHAHLDEAISEYHPVKPLVSTPFKINGKEITMAKNEGIAESQNTRCKCYEYLSERDLWRFIDTPAYGTTTTNDDGQQMTEGDGTIPRHTRHLIEKLKSLHFIVIVVKSTQMELPPSYLESLKRNLANFNKPRVRNWLFVITDFELAPFTVDKAAKAVDKILHHISPTRFERASPNSNLIFIYNEGLRSLIAHKLGEQMSDSEMDRARLLWQMAHEQCHSLVSKVWSLHPWREKMFRSIFKKKPVLKSTKKESK